MKSVPQPKCVMKDDDEDQIPTVEVFYDDVQEIENLEHPLPMPIRIRVEKTKLHDAEFKKAMKAIGGIPDFENAEASLHRLYAIKQFSSSTAKPLPD